MSILRVEVDLLVVDSFVLIAVELIYWFVIIFWVLKQILALLLAHRGTNAVLHFLIDLFCFLVV